MKVHYYIIHGNSETELKLFTNSSERNAALANRCVEILNESDVWDPSNNPVEELRNCNVEEGETEL